jgi:hypothetical protein
VLKGVCQGAADTGTGCQRRWWCFGLRGSWSGVALNIELPRAQDGAGSYSVCCDDVAGQVPLVVGASGSRWRGAREERIEGDEARCDERESTWLVSGSGLAMLEINNK